MADEPQAPQASGGSPPAPAPPDAAAAAAPAVPHVNPWIVAISVMFATFMEVLDTTVVNVSLPHIAGNLSASTDEATWALTSYLVANAIILPITGWLSSQFGRKRLLMMSVTGFTLSSLLCGIAPSLAMLILFRVIQGATGGCLQPLSQAVLLEAFPPQDRGKAMGLWGLGVVVAPILGPVLGGWLTDNYSWRWVFYINIPVGIVSILMTQRFVFDPPYLRRATQRVDYWGLGLLAVGIGALQILLDKGQQEDWFASDLIITLSVICTVALVWFVIHELTTPEPIVDLRVLKIRTYATGTFLMTVVGFVLYGSLVLLPLFLQQLLGYPALQAGIAMAPRGLGSFIAMPIVGMITQRVDARKLLALGVIGGGSTLIWLGHLNLQAGYWDIFWPQFVQGLSLALLFVPLTTVTMGPISRQAMGNATSLFNLMRNMGGSMGIAAAATMLARWQQTMVNHLGEHVNVYDPQAQAMLNNMRGAFIAGGADPATAADRANAALFGLVQRHAYMLSVVDIFRWFGVIFLVMLPLILLLKRPPTASGGSIAAH